MDFKAVAIWLGRTALTGIVSFAAPRALVGLGLPIDQWATDAGKFVGLHFSPEAALWSFTTIIFAVLLFLTRNWGTKHLHHLSSQAETNPPASETHELIPTPAAKPPTLAVGLGQDTTPEFKTVWLEIGNSGDTDAIGLVARLIESKPPLFEARRDPIGLPLVLTTKARFDRHRTKLEPLPQRPFNVARGDKKLIPVFRAERFNPTFATIISEAGEIQVIFQECELTIEVTGGGCKAFRSIITIKSAPTGSWTDSLAIEAVGLA